jgi:DNA-binding transcriptional ArsR family regulator
VPAKSTARARKAPAEPVDVDSLKAIADPTRIRLGLLMLDAPKTVKELAAALEVPPTRLYYHVRLLERHGYIRVARRRMVSGIEERSYLAVADKWNVGPDVAASALQRSGLLRALFSAMRAEMEAVIAHAPPRAPIDDVPLPMLGVSEVVFSTEGLAEFQARLETLIDDFSPERADAEGRRYRLFLAGYPTPTNA